MKKFINILRGLIHKLKSVKLKHRMARIYIIGGVLPMVVVCMYLMNGTKRLLLEQTKNSEISELTMMKDALLGSVKVVSDVSKRFYFDAALENIAFHQYERYEEVITDYKNYTKMTDHRGYYIDIIQWICVYLENDTISNNSRFVKVDDGIAEEKWYQKAESKNGRGVWSYIFNSTKDAKYLSLTRQIKTTDKKDVGVLVIHLRNERILEAINSRNKETFILLDEAIIASNNKEDMEKEIIVLVDSCEDEVTYRKIKYKGKESVLTVINTTLSESDNTIKIASIEPYGDILEKSNMQSFRSVLFIAFSILVSGILFSQYFKSFNKRVNLFSEQMHEAAKGNFKIQKKISGNDEISELYDYLNIMIDGIQSLISDVYEEQMQKEQLHSRQKEVEFKMLASQINPHFLYNTLETIRMKARCNNEPEIEELVKMLAEIMRRNIAVGSNPVSLKSEINLFEYYLKIQKYRFGDRIHYKIEISADIKEIMILPLILQPIVENAVVHGLESKEGQGNIIIKIEKQDLLHITISDNGNGISEEKLIQIKNELNDFSKLDRTHIGISNVNQRIKLFYGDEYGIEIESKENHGTTVKMALPQDMKTQV